MPMKSLAYKFLNTIIDDIFAFALETPTLHRVSVFKDDIIFVIFMFQLIAYRNNKRVNSDEVVAPSINNNASKIEEEKKEEETVKSEKEKKND